MKKTPVLLFFFCMFTFASFSQQKQTRYLEVPAVFDAVGNIRMTILPEKADTTLNCRAINQLISRGQTPQRVINLLAAEGWQLLFVVNTGRTDGMPASIPNFLYYFKRE